jgi:NADPH2:quinone reductase
MTPSLQLQSTVRNDGMLEITLASVELASPGPDEVIIKVEASPINPSDLGLLFGPADIGAAINSGTGSQRLLSAPIPEKLRAGVSVRAGQPLPVGNEGAGVVVEAGESESAQALLGRTVAVFGGGMYAQYRCVAAATCLPLPSGTSARDGASCFVNPLTVLGMVETMRMESHVGLIHTVGASNLGQMLIKVCLADGVPLVNIVRSPEQVEMLKDLGAEHVCNSSADSFRNDLVAALEKTEATLAFDAIAGGALASQILTAMERVAGRDSAPSNRYGSTTHKQVYLYGGLDVSPTVLKRNYGMAWGVGGWLLPNFLVRIGADKGNELRGRVANEIKTTFASHYTQEISLVEALEVETARSYQRKATGEKYLINPNKNTD